MENKKGDDSRGFQLIEDLLADSIKFAEEGKAYELLKQYWKDFPIETLRPLLVSGDPYVQSAAIFIVSELGKRACSLIHDVIPLLKVKNREIQYGALESLIVCSEGDNVAQFIHVVRSLDSEDEVIRVLAMRLTSNADDAQLNAILKFFEDPDSFHKHGLLVLLEGENINVEEICRMLEDHEPLIRKYGAIAAKRIYNKYPALIDTAFLSHDSDVRKFATDFIELNVN